MNYSLLKKTPKTRKQPNPERKGKEKKLAMPNKQANRQGISSFSDPNHSFFASER